MNLLKLCEFGKLSFQVHLAEMLMNQREKSLFPLGPGGARYLVLAALQCPRNLQWCMLKCVPLPYGQSSASVINWYSLNHAQNNTVLFKRSWQVLTIAFSSCSSASWFNKGLQRMFCFQKNPDFPLLSKKTTVSLGGKTFANMIVSFKLCVRLHSCSASTALKCTCEYLTC